MPDDAIILTGADERLLNDVLSTARPTFAPPRPSPSIDGSILARITKSKTAISVGGLGQSTGVTILHAWVEVKWDPKQKKLVDKPEPRRSSTRDAASQSGIDEYARAGLNLANPSSRIPDRAFVFVHIGVDIDGASFVWLEELRPAPAQFPARIDGATGPSAGPWEYAWTELRWRPDGGLDNEFEGQRKSTDQGMKRARNYAEMVVGFGSTTGPWGQPLVTGRGRLVPLPMPSGSSGPPVPMTIETDDEGGAQPRFAAPNPMTVVCNP